MCLKDMTKEELEVLSYADLTYMLLKENKKTMTTPELFKLICNLLEYSDESYASKIGDYYTSLTLDKRFVLLDSAEWDISDNHKIEVVVDDEEDIEESEEVDEEIDEEDVVDSEDAIELDALDDDLDDDDLDDELDDLAIVDDEENDSE